MEEIDIKDMHGVAIEHWTHRRIVALEDWLRQTWGSSGRNTWYVDQDFDLFTMVMNEEIYAHYVLKWQK